MTYGGLARPVAIASDRHDTTRVVLLERYKHHPFGWFAASWGRPRRTIAKTTQHGWEHMVMGLLKIG
jgi:hypothetical protein